MDRTHHGTNCAYRADPDEPCTCGVTERTEREMHAAWRKRAEEAETALAAMTAERDARDVAIGVLGDRVRSCEHMLACYRVGRRPSDVALDTARHTAQEVDANPLARAAVEGER